jgi:hypothetical protein
MINADQRKTLKKFWNAEKIRVVGDGEIHYLKNGIWWFGAREMEEAPPFEAPIDDDRRESSAA